MCDWCGYSCSDYDGDDDDGGEEDDDDGQHVGGQGRVEAGGVVEGGGDAGGFVAVGMDNGDSVCGGCGSTAETETFEDWELQGWGGSDVTWTYSEGDSGSRESGYENAQYL